MFGIIRPCSHRLSEGLRDAWMAHLCGLCLALRDDHGQAARIATNYDGLIISVLVEAQSADTAKSGRRKAGPCPLRGMRTAEVSRGEGARLAAAVSLVLAAAKMQDHVDDRDGVFARKPVAGGARRVATRWARQGGDSGHEVGFDTALLTEAVSRQADVEALAGPGTPVLAVTEPTEAATGAAFAHTAVLAGCPENAASLEEAGRLFGRLAHLLDAVEDVYADHKSGAWNPLLATETGPDEAYRLCRDAAHGIKLALRDVEFTDRKLVHALLVHEVEHAVDRTFTHAGYAVPEKPRGGSCGGRGHRHEAKGSAGVVQGPESLLADGRSAADLSAVAPAAPAASNPQAPPGWQPPSPGNPFGPQQPGGPGWNPQPPGWNPPPGGGNRPPGQRHNPLLACLIWVGLCCTCQACCREEYTNPCTGQRREGCCRDCDGCDCDCGCCDCCDGCGDCGDCSCDCGC